MRFHSARADKITAVVLCVLGASMAIGGYSMDRLEIRQIHPASIPGLLPMVLGVTMVLCSVLLYLSAKDTDTDGFEPEAHNHRNLFFAAGYSVFYALVLVGNMPFFAATAIYIAVFVTHFTLDRSRPIARQAMTVGFAIVFALVFSGAIAALFRYAFLVRLP